MQMLKRATSIDVHFQKGVVQLSDCNHRIGVYPYRSGLMRAYVLKPLTP